VRSSSSAILRAAPTRRSSCAAVKVSGLKSMTLSAPMRRSAEVMSGTVANPRRRTSGASGDTENNDCLAVSGMIFGCLVSTTCWSADQRCRLPRG
jgi:hypothetical protein